MEEGRETLQIRGATGRVEDGQQRNYRPTRWAHTQRERDIGADVDIGEGERERATTPVLLKKEGEGWIDGHYKRKE